jgi:hypothetical protein
MISMHFGKSVFESWETLLCPSDFPYFSMWKHFSQFQVIFGMLSITFCSASDSAHGHLDSTNCHGGILRAETGHVHRPKPQLEPGLAVFGEQPEAQCYLFWENLR